MAKSFSFSPTKEVERQELAAHVEKFLNEGGEIQKAVLPLVFPVPKPPRVIHGSGTRSIRERADDKGSVEE